MGEAAFPPLLAGTLGISGLLAEAATVPIPEDGIVYEMGTVIAYQITDLITSGASAFYDYGRFNRTFKNHLTVGISPEEGTTLVYWP